MKRIEEDRKHVIDTAIELGFSNKSFLVTGATGMIGRLLINVLKEITSESNVYVLGLNIEETQSVFAHSNFNKISFENLNCINSNIDYIIHLASPTNSKYLKEKPVETISFICNSTEQILSFASKHDSRVLYISSMEVYGEVLNSDLRDETKLGDISLTNTRNSYPEAKRLCELLCYSYSEEYKLQVNSVRLSQTFGAGTIQSDPRVFGYFGRCVLNNEDIVLKTKGDSFGNYCYIADTLCAFFYVLANGVPGETYNVVGDNCRSTILDLANMVATKIANNKIKILFDLDDNGVYPKPTKLFMDNQKLKSIGWLPKYELFDMFTRMIDSWKE